MTGADETEEKTVISWHIPWEVRKFLAYIRKNFENLQ